MSRTLKEKIAKIYTCTNLKWSEALNLALWDVWNTLRQSVGLTPAEILF